jgi:hypothetical protein
MLSDCRLKASALANMLRELSITIVICSDLSLRLRPAIARSIKVIRIISSIALAGKKKFLRELAL